MIEKVITYTDYDGNEQTETAWFHLSKTKRLDLQVTDGRWSQESMRSLFDRFTAELKEEAPDRRVFKEMLDMVKAIIRESYGVRSEDGKGFKQSDELSEAFVDSAAFPELYTELALNPEAQMEFVQGIVGATTEQAEEARKQVEAALNGDE